MPEQKTGPFSRSANAYWKRSWKPFPVKGKNEFIPGGITGIKGKDPGWGQIQEWLDKRPFSNVAVKACGWIAIDVDHDPAEGKHGRDSLDKAERELGALPDTWTSTSWGPDSPRRHHFYKIPVGFSVRLSEGRFVKRFGPDVDIVHAGHRYAVVAPSVHPDNGQPYLWYRPDGTPGGRYLPSRTDDLAELPQAWLDFLAEQDRHATEKTTALASPRTEEDDFYDDAEPLASGWTRAQGTAEIERMLERIRTVSSNINTQAGGAMRQVGRFVPGWLSEEDAVAACRDALRANPAHSDEWNLSNGKDWNSTTLAAMSVARGMEEPHEVRPDEPAPAVPADSEAGTPDTGEDTQDVSKLYTEAAMAARLAREVVPGRFCYVAGMGWLDRTDTHWAERTGDERIVEAVRVWAIKGYERAVADYFEARRNGADHELGDDPHVKGWYSMQGLARMKRVIELARGVPGAYREAREFDADPWRLNTPSGVVNLKTGEVTAHHPDQLHTKVTGARYVAGAQSEALKKALEALPADVHDWFQLRLGEAVTGLSGDQLVLCTGGGRNGKTAIMGAVYRALGGYARKVPNTLLMKGKNPGGATPEKMTLRGVRLAYIEETPEESYLDSQVAKDLLDAEVVEGRHLYKSFVEWNPTHSIFLNTNHPPRVTDTGDGSWRRLTRVDFPYRYRKPGEAFERETDRAGDPGIKAALRSPEGQEALLVWMVAGAMALARAGSLEGAAETPGTVLAGIQRWREESDPILRFIGERISLDKPGAWVANTDLYRAFTEWADANGLKRMSSAALFTRLEGHSALPSRVGKVKRRTAGTGLSRPVGSGDWLGDSLPDMARGWSGLAFLIEDDGL